MSKTKIFIAVGSTAMKGLEKLITRLKECGIYTSKEIEEKRFNDLFFAFDTDKPRLDEFALLGSSDQIKTIHMKMTETNVANPSLPTHKPEKFIAPFNRAWSKGKVEINRHGVFGDRERSYADLSWVDQFRAEIRKIYGDPKAEQCRAEDFELIFIATSYGGTSSGSLLNIAEIARTCVQSATPSYCLLMLPDISLQRLAGGKDGYSNGWCNFLNYWQQTQQIVWERKLASANIGTFVFPFYAGYMDKIDNQTCMDLNLFKVKADIENYKPSKTGCFQLFNNVYPLTSPSPDHNWVDDVEEKKQHNSIAEMAFFLFYAGAVLSDGVNLSTTQQTATEHEERGFVGLRLLGARCSTYGSFYPPALKQFNEECKRYLNYSNSEYQGDTGDIQTIFESFSNFDRDKIFYFCKRDLKVTKKSLEDWKNFVQNKFCSGEKDKDQYLEDAEEHVLSFPSFEKFVDNYEIEDNVLSQVSVLWYRNTYKAYYDAIKNESNNYEFNRATLMAICENVDAVCAKYANSTLSRLLNAKDYLVTKIREDAVKLMEEAYERYHKSVVAKVAIEKFEKTFEKKSETIDQERSFPNRVSAWLINQNQTLTIPTWDALASNDKLNLDKAQNGNNDSMFVRIINEESRVDYDLSKDDGNIETKKRIRREIHKLLRDFVLRNTPGRIDFDKAMTSLIDDMKSVSNKKSSEGEIPIKLAEKQEEFWPKDKVINGQDPVFVYYAKPGPQFKIGDISYEYLMEHLKNLNSIPNDQRNTVIYLGDDGGIKTKLDGGGARAPEFNALVKTGAHLTTITCPSNGRTAPADMYGVWVGEGNLTMSAKNVLSVYGCSLSSLVPRQYSNPDALVDKIQSRLLFTLHEMVYFGIILGILKKKFSGVSIGNTSTVQVTIGEKYSTNGFVNVRDFGCELKQGEAVLSAVPLDLMNKLSGWFKRDGKTHSAFATEQGAKELEDNLVKKELSLWEEDMTFSIPKGIQDAITALYEKCDKLVNVDIKQSL